MKGINRRTVFVIILILAVVGATTYGFYPRAVAVDLAAVTRSPLQVTIEEEGRTRLKDRFLLSAPVAGYMRRIAAKVGDTVKRGQIVVTLEPLRSPELDPRSLAEAQAVVAATRSSVQAATERERMAIADVDYIEKRLERMRNLFAKGSIAKDQLDQIEAEAQKARAAKQAGQAAVDVARAELTRAQSVVKNFSSGRKAPAGNIVHVYSPVDGNIFRLYRESEGAVNVGEPLLDIGNVKNLEVRVEVLSADAVKIKPGTAVLMKRWGGEGTLRGVVRIVEPAGFTKISSLGVEEQRVLIIADITSPPEIWRSLGDAYRLEAHFVIWEGKDVLQVPVSALFRQGDDWAVFTARKGRAAKRLVKIGQKNALAAEIISGLTENEQVIAHPDDAVKDGTRIKARK
jgi:HlyD family secretion protein